MQNFDITFYRKENNDCPVEEFLDSLDSKMGAKVLGYISLLAQNGPLLRAPYSKHLDDGIFELRTQQGTDITRVLYFFFAGKNIVLTNGFVKKTQKTPPGEIALAKKYRADYLKRMEGTK